MAPDTAAVRRRARPDRPPLWRRAWLQAVGIAGFLATIATLVGFAQQNTWIGLWDGDRASPGPSVTPTVVSTPTDVRTASPTTEASERRRLLAELTPLSGGSHLVPLRGGQDAGNSLGLRCAAGTTQDPYREVRYGMAVPHERLTTEVITSDIDDPDAAVQVDVLSGRSITETVVVRGSASVAVTAELSEALEVGLRVTCQRPGGFVILKQPSVHRRS